jgi:chloramphenicol 3-O-phosphotransferase
MRLVFLHGLGAAGKLTVGKALAARTGFALFHNHLIVDSLLALFPFGDPDFVRLRHQFWLDAMEAAARQRRSLIFTFAPEPSVPMSFVDELTARVRPYGRIHFVRLVVSETEQERRIANPDRAAYRKLTSVDLLRQLRAEGGARLLPPADLELDTEALTPEDAAERIVDAFGLPRV